VDDDDGVASFLLLLREYHISRVAIRVRVHRYMEETARERSKPTNLSSLSFPAPSDLFYSRASRSTELYYYIRCFCEISKAEAIRFLES
jgi:hypothetical protein